MVYLLKLLAMRLSFAFATCKLTALGALVILSIMQISCLAQTSAPVKGYGKAEYSAVKSGKFMRTWLVAGPFSIGDDSSPGAASQEKAFKTDMLSAVNVTSGNPAPPVLVKQKEFKWQPVCQETILSISISYLTERTLCMRMH